jgi:hypothetical protein
MSKLQLIFVSLFLAISFSSFSQVGIGTDSPNASAALDITSTTSGFLMPRMTDQQRLDISEPAAGLMVYVTDFDGGTIMIYEGTKWKEFLLFEARTVPDVPTMVTATPGVTQAQVSYTAPSNDGGSPITVYTATSSPGGFTGTLSQAGSGFITVSGLTNGTTYTFTITATNAIGTSVSSASNSVTPSLSVGSFYQGGVVFYLFKVGDTGYVEGEIHGLISAVEDQDYGVEGWQSSDNFSLYGTNTTIGKGSANTDLIISRQSSDSYLYTAWLARAYIGGGYTDWFLPSKDELNQMYLNKEAINTTALNNGGSIFLDSYYSSSSEEDRYNTWAQYFNNGIQFERYKAQPANVRAVRAF